jgi:prepilin-type N-terminal cleavage/methylation domain-containing protein
MISSRSTRMPRRARASSRDARGYTIVEVLLAMTVLTIGAAGAISMQKAAIQGNLDARKTDIAANIARMWMERIQRDSMSWTSSNPSNLSNAALLGNATTTVNKWFLPFLSAYATPGSGFGSVSPGFDMLGRDVPSQAGLANSFFCVHLRETWLAQNTTPVTNSLLRVELRVVWPRGIAQDTYAPPLCDPTSAATPNPDPRLYSTLYMVTAVRANGTPSGTQQ